MDNIEASKNNSTLPEPIPEGKRNITIFGQGCLLRRQGVEDKEIRRILHEENATRCIPPLSASEMDNICRNVLKYKSGKPMDSGRTEFDANNARTPELAPTEQAARQIESLFSPEDFVTIVKKFKKENGKWRPCEKGKSYSAYKLVQDLRNAERLEDVFPNYNKNSGMTFCINPVNKCNERKNENIAAFRHVLVEYDDIPIEEQIDRYIKSGMPISSITRSGGKSVHALVRIDAESADEYSARVWRLYTILEQMFGSKPDPANKNPSRLSRLAGAKRGKNEQTLLFTEVNTNVSFEEFLARANLQIILQSERFQHQLVGDFLIEHRGACIVDGMPVIKTKEGYQVGCEAIERETIGICRNATAHQRKEVTSFISLAAPRRIQAEPKFIRFDNGILDIEAMELLPADEDIILLNRIPHNWNPDAQSALVDSTFARIAKNDPAIIANLWEMFGLCMYRGHEVSKMILLQGEGANGKSTVLELLNCMLGSANCFSLPIHELGEKFQLVPAMGKLALVGDDIASDFVNAKACAVMKKFVTGELINDQYKGGATFQFAPYATLVYSCNDVPRFADASFGFERRVHPIPLSARFTPQDEGYDPKLKQKLRTEECVEYAIVQGVLALKACLERLDLTDNRLSKSMAKDMLKTNDPVLLFIEESKQNGYAFVGKTNSEVYDAYRIWCTENCCAPANMQTFSKSLCRHENLTTASSNGTRRYTLRLD